MTILQKAVLLDVNRTNRVTKGTDGDSMSVSEWHGVRLSPVTDEKLSVVPDVGPGSASSFLNEGIPDDSPTDGDIESKLSTLMPGNINTNGGGLNNAFDSNAASDFPAELFESGSDEAGISYIDLSNGADALVNGTEYKVCFRYRVTNTGQAPSYNFMDSGTYTTGRHDDFRDGGTGSQGGAAQRFLTQTSKTGYDDAAGYDTVDIDIGGTDYTHCVVETFTYNSSFPYIWVSSGETADDNIFVDVISFIEQDAATITESSEYWEHNENSFPAIGNARLTFSQMGVLPSSIDMRVRSSGTITITEPQLWYYKVQNSGLPQEKILMASGDGSTSISNATQYDNTTINLTLNHDNKDVWRDYTLYGYPEILFEIQGAGGSAYVKHKVSEIDIFASGQDFVRHTKELGEV